MSWSFEFKAVSKPHALKVLDTNIRDCGDHLPSFVKRLLIAGVKGLPDCPNSIILVSTHGHVHMGEGRATSNLSIKVENVIEESLTKIGGAAT